jgi:hypothetical protein
MLELFPRRSLWLLPVVLLLLLLLLAGCALHTTNVQETETAASPTRSTLRGNARLPTATPDIPHVKLTLSERDVVLASLPLRAGIPFTITSVIHNDAGIPATDVPLMVYMSALQDQFGYVPFVQVLTVTVPATSSLTINVPVHWNLAGGEYQLWVQVNRLPDAWQDRFATLPELDTANNMVLLDLMVDPFDAYASDLCSGRTDVEIGPTDVLPEPEHQRVAVTVHNSGNRAAYNLPVVVLGNQLAGISYTPAIPPCGGTTQVYVDLNRPLVPGDPLTIQVNPQGWPEGLEEDDFRNNSTAVNAGLAPSLDMPSVSGLQDYDFGISLTDIQTQEPSMVLVTVHNWGTRDAAMVPIRIENQAGRKVNDAIPLVQGNGLGVAAISIGSLWTRGGTLTLTVNPQGAKDALPETNRDNNVAVLTLP